MTKLKLVLVTAALVLSAGLAGCLSSSAADGSAAEGSEDDGDRSAHEVPREELSSHQIVFEPATGEWAVARFTVDQLLGDKTEANLTIAAEPDQGAQPYIGLVVRATYQNESMPFSFWLAMDEERSSQTLSIESSDEAPGSFDIAILVGTNHGGTTFRLGLTEGIRAQSMARQEESVDVPLLEDRPELDVAPDATGEGGAAGTAMVQGARDDLRVLENGNLDVTADEGTVPVADVQRSVGIAGDGEIAGDGIGGLILAAEGEAGAGEWSLDAALPPAAWDEDAVDVDPSGAVGLIPHTVREIVGVEPALAYGSLQVEPGQASLDFSRDYNGVGRRTMASWGWATFDPAEVYGWDWKDITV